MNELALFAGAGGGILGSHLLGWRTVCAVEFNAYARSVLLSRQNDRTLAPFPIWDDIRTFDGKPWRGIVDVVSGGFPCQDISAAGKGAGIDGERSGMWREMARIIHEVRPRFVYVENSPMLTSRGLGTVLGDLAKMGFDARWGVLGAADVGAPHQRDRIWIRARQRNILSHSEHDRNGWWQQQSEGSQEANGDVANPTKLLCYGGNNNAGVSVEQKTQPKPRDNSWPQNLDNPNSTQRQGNQRTIGIGAQHANLGGSSWWEIEPSVGRVVDGMAARVDRLKAIGNGQVPAVAATAWEILSNEQS